MYLKYSLFWTVYNHILFFTKPPNLAAAQKSGSAPPSRPAMLILIIAQFLAKYNDISFQDNRSHNFG
jgi:hypothetical protein